jgi:glutathione S-transferase
VDFVLVSHHLCPYVQRAAIVLREKGLPFERRDVDLADKPAWFRAVSPLGKTPVLLADGQALFESAVICEYLDEVTTPRLHPDGPLARARERAWMAFGSSLLDAIAAYYNAPDAQALAERRAAIVERFARIESELDAQGPWFAGARFGLVDAVFAPALRYFDTFETLGEGGWFDALPRVTRWRAALAARPSVRDAVDPGYPGRLRAFLLARAGLHHRRAHPAVPS